MKFSYENPTEFMRVMRQVTYRCKCGHSVVIPAFVNKKICHWCGKWVYKSDREEFKEKLRKEIKKFEK